MENATAQGTLPVSPVLPNLNPLPQNNKRKKRIFLLAGIFVLLVLGSVSFYLLQPASQDTADKNINLIPTASSVSSFSPSQAVTPTLTKDTKLYTNSFCGYSFAYSTRFLIKAPYGDGQFVTLTVNPAGEPIGTFPVGIVEILCIPTGVTPNVVSAMESENYLKWRKNETLELDVLKVGEKKQINPVPQQIRNTTKIYQYTRLPDALLGGVTAKVFDKSDPSNTQELPDKLMFLNKGFFTYLLVFYPGNRSYQGKFDISNAEFEEMRMRFVFDK